eukprot:jgi/Orpsp1_1/1192269/evm.model.d7180000091865.1
MGKYVLSYNNAENILSGLNSNDNDVCVLTGPTQHNSGNYVLYKVFDGVIGEYNGFCS